ncbi:hypothetical protein CLRAG_29860 [Clostridium ragsdalei P11]|uniref:Tetratricopeptide repeat protein n=1 Tax=Clostridium ragsdalei P11 TaxID=1353534 RepID=A0A1A6AMX2_9CLOT|nr:hypothetical protein [Clostridium ragsdalei]OBR91419.1 hypothetical protein CLRAG_29860 [Clostridium ragsdalei P11]
MGIETKRLSTKKNIIIILSILIIGSMISLGFYYFDKIRPYENILLSANKAMTAENYDEAINLYTEAETYKKTSDIDSKIQLAGILKKSKLNYKLGIQKMDNKDYLNAVDYLKKVNRQDSKRYNTALNKINKCKKLYISDNFAKAKGSLNNNKFDDANKYLNNISKIDDNNSCIKELKNDIAKAIQKQKEEISQQLAVAQTNSVSKNVNDDYTPEMAIKLAMEKDKIESDPNLLTYCDSTPLYDSNGKKYFHVFLKNKILVNQGGSGTIDNLIIAKDGTTCSADEVKQ